MSEWKWDISGTKLSWTKQDKAEDSSHVSVVGAAKQSLSYIAVD